MIRPLLAAAFFLAATVAPLPAWDAGGHMLVTEIAARKLNPGVMEKIAPLLPLLDSCFNAGRPYNFVTAGVWLDDIKGAPKEYPWSRRHYVDLPCGNTAERPVDDENAYTALEQAVTRLSNNSATQKEQAEAVAHLLHIVADIHQPLHVSTRGDRGGNGYLLVPLVAPPPSSGNSFRPFNLHRFWDCAYRFGGREKIVELWRYPSVPRRPKGPYSKGVIGKEAERLLAEYPKESLGELEGSPDVWTWIVEGHAIGCQSGWPPGPAPRSYEVARLTPEFVEASHRIAERRIVLAGYRLAALLNKIYSE